MDGKAKVIYEASSGNTFLDIKRALARGDAQDKFPMGTEIPDVWDSMDSPLIIAQYLDSSNNSRYGGAEGVILVRKYAQLSRVFYSGSGSNSAYYYDTSNAVRGYLTGTTSGSHYYDSCSEEIESIISDITVQCVDVAGSTKSVTGRWFFDECN